MDVKHRRRGPLTALGMAVFLLIPNPQAPTFAQSSPKPGAKNSAMLLLDQFESLYAAHRSLQASFLERYIENSHVVRSEAGIAYFLRPGKMRWDYEAPEKNTFLVDGKFAWFFAPADHTATRMPVKQSSDWRTPLAFLTNEMKLSRICSEVVPALSPSPSAPENLVYVCTFRSNGDTDTPKSVSFELSPHGELARLVVDQPVGVRIEFAFKNWLWNPAIPKSLFRFDPPPGVAIVNALLPDSPQGRP
jgi:outer membrane lipoprotein carrier protein